MLNSKKVKSMTGVWGAVIFLLFVLFFIGDVYNDMVITPDKAFAKCGQGNVENVLTKGFYKREITCFSESTSNS